MAENKEVPEIPAAAALDGTEQVHVVQGSNSRRSTVDDFVTRAVASQPNLRRLRGASFQIAVTPPDSDELLLAWTPPLGEIVEFAEDLDGSSFGRSTTATDPAATYTMPVKRNGVQVGSIGVSTIGGVTFVAAVPFTVEGGTDLLEVFGATVADAAVGFTFTIAGTLTDA